MTERNDVDRTPERFFEGTRSRLVVVGPEHYEPLRRLEAVRLGLFWRSRGVLNSPEDFARRIWHGTAFQALAVGKSDDRILLWLQCYNLDPGNAIANLAVARLDERPMGLRAAGGFAAFIDYCFVTFGLRKLYLEVASPNLPQFQQAVGSLFMEEGRLMNHIRGPERDEDLIILSLWRSLWLSSDLRIALLERF